MMRQTTFFGGTLVALASATLIVGCLTLRRIDAGLSDPPLVEALAKKVSMRIEQMGQDPMITRWPSAGGLQQEVVTHPHEGEDEDAQAARHAKRVAALLAQFPSVLPH